MKYIDWNNELPSNFDELDIDARLDILEELFNEKELPNFYFSDCHYPFASDIAENALPRTLLETFCCFEPNIAISVIEKYPDPQFMILALNHADEYVEPLVNAILSKSSSLTEDVFDTLFEYLNVFFDSAIYSFEEVFASSELPEKFIRKIYQDFPGVKDTPSALADMVNSPSMNSEELLREIATFFVSYDDYDDEEKYHLWEALSKNKYLPKDVIEVLKSNSDDVIADAFTWISWDVDDKNDIINTLLESPFVPDDKKKLLCTE